MKKLANLKGVRALNRIEQKTVYGHGGLDEFGDPAGGGSQRCDGSNPPCPDGKICCGPPGGAQYCQPCPCGDTC